MKFLDFFKRNRSPQETEKRSLFGDALTYAGSPNTISEYKSMLLSTVYRCVDLISNSVASLPFEPYEVSCDGYRKKLHDHSIYHVLNYEPNERMTRFIFMKALVTSMILRGNGYAYIERDKLGNVIKLDYLDSDRVSPIIDYTQNTIKYYVVSGYKVPRVEPINMIHLINFTYDGITGVSTLKSARGCLSAAYNAEQTAAGFFTGGCNVGGILKVQGMLNEIQKQQLKSSWQQAFSPETGQPNGVAVLEGNMDFSPITVNPADAQLLESRQYNVIDICRFFGVNPTKVFDLTKASYSTVEAENLQFLNDTLQPIIEKIEQEFQRKLFKPSEKAHTVVRFDTSSMLRTDKNSQASYYSTLFNMGAMSINEIRKALDLEPIEGGDTHYVQVNMGATNNNEINEEGNQELQE